MTAFEPRLGSRQLVWIRSRRRQLLLPSLIAFFAVSVVELPFRLVNSSWAEETCPVTTGLTSFFDSFSLCPAEAGVQQDGSASAQQVSVSEWTAYASSKLAATCDQPQHAPSMVKVAGRCLVRFDGVDDRLRVTRTGLGTENATIFLVAAIHNNDGGFRGLFSSNAQGQRDYESGLTIDLGPNATQDFSQLNIEGCGFGGHKNLRQAHAAFGQLQVIQITLDADNSKVSLSINGTPEGERPFDRKQVSFDELTLGARFYTNGIGEQQVRGHFQGDMAALLIYDRVLSEHESTLVFQFLSDRYVELNEPLQKQLPPQPDAGIPLVKARDPRPVQILVPGFSVRELPVEIKNVNNIRTRRDGKLVALCYSGDIIVLSDTDGDGLEDSSKTFWKNTGSIRGPIGMVLSPENYPHGQGVLLSSKGKVSMIVDRDGDDVGDEELIVASGWQEIPQNVDAVGLAMDKEGYIYFGLGTANFASPYLIDEAGVAQYDLNSERGTVQRVSPDWKVRETICTGIRFPIGLAFNYCGDLFCTDQEGATWLPNGNPLDELLHIRLDGAAPMANPTGKQHFGFPPRHPQHNPKVIDEPSLFDYSPQHQSTCGLLFIGDLEKLPTFGPCWWGLDAIVCGQSRGKIWRTKLTKTAAGYIANSQLFACLQMLTVDACLTLAGELVVACHSGPPDWGTGPEGVGKLFKIRMRPTRVARPIAAWWSNRGEIQIAFDSATNPQFFRNLTDKITIHYGEHVRAGDQYENLVPPYSVVQQQLKQPRFNLPVHSVGISPDARSCTLKTDAISQATNYSISMPVEEERMELDVSPNGAMASWTALGAEQPAWECYLPHFDLLVCDWILSGATSHDTLWRLIDQPGQLRIEAIIDFRELLRPATQQGERIDYDWPPEDVQLHVESNAPLSITVSSVSEPNDKLHESIQSPGEAKIPLPYESGLARLSLEVATGTETVPIFSVTTSTAEDATRRAIPLKRFFLPFFELDSVTEQKKSATGHLSSNQIADGSWGRGRRLFHDQRTQCSKCHSMGNLGEGIEDQSIGPDLGHLPQRDRDSVLVDILQPNRTINPDFLTYTVALVDGRVLTGTVRSEGTDVIVSNSAGETTRIPEAHVESQQTSGVSIMPEGLLDKLSDAEKTDLISYLCETPPRMPQDVPLEAPSLRSMAEVAAALEGSQPITYPLEDLNIVLVDGVKDHGPGEHDYPAWKRAWADLLSGAEGVQVSTANEFPDENQLSDADVIIFFQKGSFSIRRELELDKFLKRGGGAVFIHWAVNGSDRVEQFAQRIGLASWGGRISYRHGPLSLEVVDQQHPIMRNLERLELYDESYWKLTGDLSKVQVLATSLEDGQATPQLWVRDHAPGRVFVSIPGHYSWTFDDPLFRILLLRGIAWTSQQLIDRFNDLVTPGARISNSRFR